MMLSLVYWHLLHSSLSGEIKSKKTLYWEKKYVREMTVEVRFFSGCPGCYLGKSRDFPYNRNDAILIPFLLSRLLAPPRGEKIVRLFDTGLSVIVVCMVVSNSLIPGPETIDMTSLIEFDKLCFKCF